jgi:hypothetical protein
MCLQLKIKLFDANVVMEAESQAVLNTLTEHDFWDAFKKIRNAGMAHTHCFEGDGGQ